VAAQSGAGVHRALLLVHLIVRRGNRKTETQRVLHCETAIFALIKVRILRLICVILQR
jgi:hypothetical protein